MSDINDVPQFADALLEQDFALPIEKPDGSTAFVTLKPLASIKIGDGKPNTCMAPLNSDGDPITLIEKGAARTFVAGEVIPNDDVVKELEAVHAKFPSWPADPFHAVNVVAEELGELQRQLNQFVYEGKGTLEDVRKEAVQTAAMAHRFLMGLSLYDFAPAKQVHQTGVVVEQ